MRATTTRQMAAIPTRPSATVSGASGYLNKEHFGADALQRLWQQRDSGVFVRP